MHQNTIKDLLRLEEEKFVFFDEVTIHDFLIENCCDYMNFLLSFYEQDLENLNIQLPLKQLFYTPQIKGDYRIMPCNIDDLKLKCVKVIGTNEENKKIKDKISVGKAFLIDYFDNYIYAMFDVCVLSSFRTAAISVIALKLLVEKNKIQKIGILGSGRIGFYTAYILYKWLGIKDFNIYDENIQHQDNFYELVKIYMPDCSVRFEDSENIYEKSLVVFACTTSTKAILNSHNCRHLHYISSVGADANNLSEVDRSILTTHQLWIDFEQTRNLGDMKKWKDSDTTINYHCLSGDNKNVKIGEKILFISTGVAFQDALSCYFIYNNLSREKI